MIKKRYLFLVIALFATNSFSNRLTDSLKLQLIKQKGIDFMNTSLKIAEEYSYGSKSDSIYKYSSLSYNKAREYNNSLAMMKSSLYWASGLYSAGKTEDSRKKLEEVLKLANKLNRQNEIVQHNYMYARTFQKDAKYDLAIEWFKKAYFKSLNMVKSGTASRQIKAYLKVIMRQMSYTYAYNSNLKVGEEFFRSEISKINKSVPKDIERSYYSNISYVYSQGANCRKAVEFSKKALEISLKSTNKNDQLQDYINIATALGGYELNESIEYLFKSLEYLKNPEHSRTRAWVYNAIAKHLNSLGKFKESIEYQYRGIEIQKESKDSLGLAYSYLTLGAKFFTWNDFDESEKYLLSALKYFKRKKIKIKLSETTGLCTYLYIKSDKPKKAAALIIDLERLSKEIKSNKNYGLYNSYKALYSLKVDKNYSNCISYYQKAINFFNKLNDTRNLACCYSYISEAYYKNGNISESKESSYKALEMLKNNEIINISKNTIQNLANIYEKENNRDSAYVYIKKLSQIEEKIFKRDATLAMYKKHKDHELLSEKEKTENLQESNKKLGENINSYKKLLLFSLIIGVLLSIIVYSVRTIKHQKVIKSKEKEKEEINKQFETTKIQVEKFSEELAEKEESLNRLKEEFEKASAGLNAENHITEISKLLSSGLVTEEHWTDFYKTFDKVFPDFIKVLNEKYPKISRNDNKILALMKLNLATNEMANLLMVSTSSLMTARYRLRKKLNMSSEDKLENIVEDISKAIALGV